MTRQGQRAATTVLVVLAVVPVALWLAPGREPPVWPLLLPLLAGAAAYPGTAPEPGRLAARLGRARHPVRTGGWVLVVCAADLLWRTVLRALVPDVRTMADVDGTTLAAAALVAASPYLAGALARRVAHAGGATLGASPVRTVGPPLTAGGAVALLASGLLQFGEPRAAWHVAAAALAVGAYTGVALLLLQRLQRAALVADWQRAGRAVDPALARHWAVWVFLLLGGALLVTGSWWTPPAEPARHAAEQPHLLDWVLSHWRPPPPPSDGEILDEVLPPPEEPLAGGWLDLSTLLVVSAVAVAVAVLLAVALALLARRGVEAPAGVVRARLRRLGAWWATLRTVLVGMLRRRAPREPPAGEDPQGQRPRGRSRLPRRRPSAPREQVRHDYRRVLEEARPACPREQWQSPREYAGTLREALPQHTAAVDTLTRAYVEARYSRHPVSAATAERSRTVARDLRAALRRRGREA